MYEVQMAYKFYDLHTFQYILYEAIVSCLLRRCFTLFY